MPSLSLIAILILHASLAAASSGPTVLLWGADLDRARDLAIGSAEQHRDSTPGTFHLDRRARDGADLVEGQGGQHDAMVDGADAAQRMEVAIGFSA